VQKGSVHLLLFFVPNVLRHNLGSGLYA
jgi:hypothetical protein